MDDELQERPVETEKRANIKGIYDPMQEKRQKYEEESMARTVFSKE